MQVAVGRVGGFSPLPLPHTMGDTPNSQSITGIFFLVIFNQIGPVAWIIARLR